MEPIPDPLIGPHHLRQGRGVRPEGLQIPDPILNPCIHLRQARDAGDVRQDALQPLDARTRARYAKVHHPPCGDVDVPGWRVRGVPGQDEGALDDEAAEAVREEDHWAACLAGPCP